MAKKHDILYVNFYTGGSAAHKIELAPPQPRYPEPAPEPKARPKQRTVIYVDPLAIVSIAVSVVMLALFYGLTLDKFIEIKERFNNAVTGLFGLQYDNSASLIIADIFGHSFRASCYYRKHNKTYELCVWDMSGQRLLCQIVTKDPQLTEKQVDELEKCHDNLMESYEKSKTSANRYKQICKYKDYIRKDNYKTGYACYTYDVYVKKDIPIELTEYEIAKYVDDWNYCFGGSINKIGTTETEDVYRVKVHTD